MPTGISQTSVNPSALISRPTSPSRESVSGSAGSTENAQSVLATNGQEIIRAPERPAGSQGAENDVDSNENRNQEAAARALSVTGLEQEIRRGLGGNIDITA
jgi:hypothetical protein